MFFLLKSKYTAVAVCVLLGYTVQAQDIRGKVTAKGETDVFPLVGANVRWLDGSQGTVTDLEGAFKLNAPAEWPAQLVASYIGYKADTLHVNGPQYLNIELKDAATLAEVTITGSPTFIADLPMKREIITRKELTKAACCNLSESFETNASVDVSYSDAVTGAKQLQMLGLDGVYVQQLSENLPSIRGLAAANGLSYTSGTWVESIDVGKGAGSVVNGYESIAGQINVELLKPEDSEKFYLNLYANHLGRLEANVHAAHKLSQKWSTGILLHADRMRTDVDMNGDGFLDMPHSTQYSGINRWKYDGDRLKSQFGIKLLTEERLGGQTGYDHTKGAHGGNNHLFYGTAMQTQRAEVFTKNGIIFPEAPYRGMGIVSSATHHKQNGYYGRNGYSGEQQTFYTNFIYQSIIGTTNHQFKTGASYMYDRYAEVFADSAFGRTESVPGVYGEYTYSGLPGFTAVTGLRADFHNMYGPFLTPRLHLRYDLGPATTLRGSAGRGLRVTNPLAENPGALVSQRAIVVREALLPEVAWNYGANLTHDFIFNNRKGMLTVDLYRTDFQNQMVIDMDASPREIRFYNLEGRSFANSFQAEAQYEPMPSLHVKAAYKFYDVRTTIDGQLLQRPFVSRHRVFFNTGYATKFDKWKFDFTTQWHGAKRIPDTSGNPEEYRLETLSPAFFLFNAQITKAFRKWEAYLGGENLGNFRQQNPIINPHQPFSENFDASLVWGPIVGRMVYAGMRFSIK